MFFQQTLSWYLNHPSHLCNINSKSCLDASYNSLPFLDSQRLLKCPALVSLHRVCVQGLIWSCSGLSKETSITKLLVEFMKLMLSLHWGCFQHKQMHLLLASSGLINIGGPCGPSMKHEGLLRLAESTRLGVGMNCPPNYMLS